MTLKRDHCWHSTGMGELVQCCWCGIRGIEAMRRVRDPEHGPHGATWIWVAGPVKPYSSDADADDCLAERK